MSELSDILNENVRMGRDSIHCVTDSAASITIADSDGDVDYVNDGLTDDCGNLTMWDTTNNALITTTIPLWSKLDVKLTSTLSFTNANGVLEVEFYVPHPDGDLSFSVISKTPKKTSVEYAECITCMGYNSQDVIDYGIKVRTSISLGDVVITGRVLLARA